MAKRCARHDRQMVARVDSSQGVASRHMHNGKIRLPVQERRATRRRVRRSHVHIVVLTRYAFTSLLRYRNFTTTHYEHVSGTQRDIVNAALSYAVNYYDYAVISKNK